MKIGGLQKLTLIDFPEKPACTVFLAGCNLKCPWCHSPNLVKPELIKKLSGISEDEFFSFLQDRVDVLDGVVVCGGEPTIHNELPEFIEKIKKLGYKVKLDTNGTAPKVLKSLLREGFVDYIAMDLKAPLENYKKATGISVDPRILRESISIVRRLDDYEFRTTVIPGIHDEKDIVSIAEEIEGAKRYYLQNFRSKRVLSEDFKEKKPMSRKKMEKIKSRVEDKFEICKIR